MRRGGERGGEIDREEKEKQRRVSSNKIEKLNKSTDKGKATLGDLDVLSQLKRKMEASENSPAPVKNVETTKETTVEAAKEATVEATKETTVEVEATKEVIVETAKEATVETTDAEVTKVEETAEDVEKTDDTAE